MSDQDGNNKKMKPSPATNNRDDLERIKQYLYDCPYASPDHPLIKAAITAVEKEQQRMERDQKLQLKFSSKQQQLVGGGMVDPMLEEEVGLVVIENRPGSPPPPPPSSSTTDRSMDAPTTDDDMEWQDVQEKGKLSCEASFLGTTLAKIAIDTIAEYSQKVPSPLAAIAVALHAGLRSDTLGFACTGIPETEIQKKGGFAPPVRELPPSQFLPWSSWDSQTSTNHRIALRYRKQGIGAVVLTVESLEDDDDDKITVRLQPASTTTTSSTTTNKEPLFQSIEFARGDFVNLDSWNAATKVSSLVSPTLHYKALALLMTRFCQTFDLGAVVLDEDNAHDHNSAAAATSITKSASPYMDNTVIQTQRSEFIPARPVGSSYGTPDCRPGGGHPVPRTLGEAFPGIVPPSLRVGGDFSGDLAPAGILDPHFFPGSDGSGRIGNLMGPNHPLFQGSTTTIPGMRGGLPYGGPGSMQPRFDPIYPDVIDFPGGGGGGQGPTNNRRGIITGPGGRPRPSGEPNPDHLPPPNSFGNDMFS